MKKFKILAILTIAVFVLSVNGHVANVAGQADNEVETNFELLLMTNAGNRIRESYAFFVKQALAPLGIDVEILAKPFGQFVGDLLHLSTGQPFDLAIIGFAGGGPTPSFMWKFHSTDTSFGQLMYQLNNAEWQEHQAQDIGRTTAEIDAMLEDIDFELDPLTRLEKINEFAELYMSDLLYDIPLTTVTSRTAAWAGYGGPNNELWDDADGLYASRALGAVWGPSTPDARNASANTLQLRVATPGGQDNFDPYQSFDTSTTAQTDPYLTSQLIQFDGAFAAHPDIAYQWIVDTVKYDDDFNSSTPDANVEAGRHTFIVNTNATFSDGTAVDANDFALALAMFKHPNTQLNGKELFNPVVKWQVTDTYKPADTLQIWLEEGSTTPDDYVTLGALNPLPEHLLGGDLTVYNETEDANHTITLGTQNGKDVTNNFTAIPEWDTTYNPQNSFEWDSFETLVSEGGTNTLVGPMEIEEYNIDEGFWSFTARDNYWFPNEWDVQKVVAADPTPMSNLYNSLNNSYAPLNASGNANLFAPHQGGLADAYYWDFAGTETNMVKPTSQGITTVVNKIIEDTNAALISFESGNLDVFGSSALGANTVSSHQDNDNFVVRNTVPVSGPTLLVFNLLNEHLQEHEVRQAIAYALDQQEMTKINDGFATSHGSPVWLVYDQYAPAAFIGAGEGGEDLSWYTSYENEYNYTKAYQLMTGLGYDARTSPDANPEPVDPPVEDVFQTIGGILGADLWIGLSAFALAATVFVRRARRFD